MPALLSRVAAPSALCSKAASPGSPNGRPSWNGVHSPRGLRVCSICDRTRPIATVGVPRVSSMCASALTARIQMGQTVSSTASIRSWRNRSLIWSAKYSAVAGSVEPITV